MCVSIGNLQSGSITVCLLLPADDALALGLPPCRYRLVRLVCPVLRLVLSLLGGAPGSAKMVSEALEFCRGQHKLLGRLLKEAAAPGGPVDGTCCAAALQEGDD